MVDKIVESLSGKKTLKGWQCLCPAHSDSSPSLSVAESGGKILFKCHAGCTQSSVIDALKSRGLWGTEKLQAKKEEYKYFNAEIKPALKVIRVDEPGKDKRVYQNHFVNGAWVPGGYKGSLAPYKYEDWQKETARRLFFVEGEKCCHALIERGFIATTTAGGASSWSKAYSSYFKDRNVTIVPDFDDAGFKYAANIFNDLIGVAKSVSVLQLPDLREKEDVFDWLAKGHTPDELKKLVESPPVLSQKLQLLIAAGTSPGIEVNESQSTDWLDPLPLKNFAEELPEISFEDLTLLLPSVLSEKVKDISERIDVAAEAVAAVMLSALGGLIGRRALIKPKKRDNWVVYPCCLWGCLVSRPGNKKSPLFNEVLQPVFELEDHASLAFKNDFKLAQPKLHIVAQKKKAIEAQIKSALAEGDTSGLPGFEADLQKIALEEERLTPVCKRYYTSDATGPKLVAILGENPSGILIIRDELSGIIQSFEQNGNESLRTLYLESWAGNGRITQDRVSTGTQIANGIGATLIGSIQPGPLGRVLSASDDGFIQRFGLLVTLKDSAHKLKDLEPNELAQRKYQNFFNAISTLDSKDPLKLNFTSEAQDLFYTWYETHMTASSAKGVNDNLRSHFSKYPSLFCALAVVIHLAEVFDETFAIGLQKEVSLKTAQRAAEWIESVFIPHARYIYDKNTSRGAAEALAAKIESGLVEDGITVRKLIRKEWSGLKTNQLVQGALEELAECNWLRVEDVQPESAGRPTHIIRLNPKLKKETSNAK